MNLSDGIGQDSESQEIETYCLIISKSKACKNEFRIQVDHGDGIDELWGPSKSLIRDESGEIIKFNTIVHAMKYMSKDGWTYVNGYAGFDGNPRMTH